MSYAIICEAQVGESLGIDHLGLVDRKKSKKKWWTSDNPNLLMEFKKNRR